MLFSAVWWLTKAPPNSKLEKKDYNISSIKSYTELAQGHYQNKISDRFLVLFKTLHAYCIVDP